MHDYTLDDYIWQLANDSKPAVRSNAAFILGRNRDEKVVQPLLTALNDDAAEVRVRVAEALGTRDETVVIAPLINTLQNDTDVDVRRTAAKSLGYIGVSSAADALNTALQDDAPEVRAAVAEALATVDADVMPLIHTFLNDDDSNVLYFAKQSLATKTDDTTINALMTELQQQKDPILLTDIVEVLALMKATQALDAIATFTSHDDEPLQAMAEWAIGVLEKSS